MQFGRGCHLGPSLPLSPTPASCLWQGWASPQPASSSLELFSPFVLRTVSGVYGQVNFLSLAMLQFKLLSQVSSLRLPSGHSVSVLTLSNATCSSPFRPHLLVADAGVWGYFSAGSRF